MISTRAPKQHIRMISEGSCDTETVDLRPKPVHSSVKTRPQVRGVIGGQCFSAAAT